MHAAFSELNYNLRDIDGKPLELSSLTLERAPKLAQMLALMLPWKKSPNCEANLLLHFTAQDPALKRFSVQYNGQCVGAVSVRYPWLKGPYLELLGLSASAQGIGIGREIMDWFEGESPDGARSLWLLCSDFNEGGIAFYQRQGFEKICLIENLYSEGLHDFLMRKIIL